MEIRKKAGWGSTWSLFLLTLTLPFLLPLTLPLLLLSLSGGIAAVGHGPRKPAPDDSRPAGPAGKGPE